MTLEVISILITIGVIVEVRCQIVIFLLFNSRFYLPQPISKLKASLDLHALLQYAAQDHTFCFVCG